MMHRHAGLLASMLGVLMAGAAYAPVDPAFPADRQSYVFSHSKCQILLADEESYQQALSLGVAMPSTTIIISPMGTVLRSPRRYSIDNGVRKLAQQRKKCHSKPNGGLMYVLYTSGSTGKPKGVMVPQYGVANFVTWFARDVGVVRDYRVLAITTVCFDISVVEIYMPLVAGATVVLAVAESQKDPYRLLDVIEDNRINFMQSVPTAYEVLLATGWKGDRNIDFLTGGEAFRHSLIPLMKECRSFRHAYGPTETTVISSSFTITPNFIQTLTASAAPVIPIGKPIGRTDFYLIDADYAEETGSFRLVFEEGELLIGGIGVARGYLHAPELTRAKFIPNPFGEGIVYRTGDLIRLRKDGFYTFVRRLDDQVKVDGYRIELAEIEFAYAQHPLVEQAVVIVRRGKLSAYLKIFNNRVLSSDEKEEIRTFISRSLTYYMVPTYTTIVTSFPWTANGKLDRNALPDPVIECLDDDEAEGKGAVGGVVIPENTMLAHVCKLMHSLKGITPKPSSTFGALGVDSLGAALFVKLLSDSLGGIRINQVKMYRSGVTVRTFADELYERLLEEKPSVVAELGLRPNHDIEAGGEEEDSEGCEFDRYEKSFASLISSNTRFINGIRGIFTVLVLWGHYHGEAYAVIPTGDAVVFLFVLVSGLATAFQLRDPLLSRGGNKFVLKKPFDWASFLFGRAVGIFPVLWLALLVNSPVWYLENTVKEPTPDWYLPWAGSKPPPKKTIIRCALLYVTGLNSYNNTECNDSGTPRKYKAYHL